MKARRRTGNAFEITRRGSALGLAATAFTLGTPAVLLGQTDATREVPELDGVNWSVGPQGTKARVYNLRTAKTPQRRARCISEDGVRRVVDWARETGTAFSVQSGGHCYEGLSQHNDLIVDVSAMTKTALDRANRLIAQPGAHLSQVNDATAAVGKVLPAGYCQNVALGGHVCGGGLGVLSRSFGLTCDNLMSARIVTSDGQVTSAASDTNPDLFWALRGGGSGSFGIVTEFRFDLQNVDQVILADQHWIVPKQDAAGVLQDIQNIVTALGTEQTAYLYCNARSKDAFYIRLRLVSLVDDMVFRSALKRIADLPPPLIEPQVVTGDFRTIADLIWPRDYNPSLWIKNKSLFFKSGIQARVWDELVDTLAEHSQHELWIALELLGGEIDALAPDETAFVHRRDASVLIGLAVTLSDPSRPQSALAALQTAFETLHPTAAQGTYVNYPDLDIGAYQKAYWGSNYARLAEVKTRYDSDNLFRHAQSVRPG